MKVNTQVWLAIRNVGDAQQSAVAYESIEQMPALSALSRIIDFTRSTSMATRFQFCMARTKEEAAKGIGLREGAAPDILASGWDSLSADLRADLEAVAANESQENAA